MDEVGFLRLGRVAQTRARARERWATWWRASRRCPTPGWATRSSTPTTWRRSFCPGIRRSAPWCSPDSIPRTPTTTRISGTPWTGSILNDASLHFDAGDVRGSGLRIPVRVPGPPPHGDHPGAAGAGVRRGPHHHRAQRRVPRDADRRDRAARWRIRRASRPGSDRGPSPSRSSKPRIVCPAEYIGNVQKLCHERRGVFGGMHYLDPQRVELDYRASPGRDRPGLLRSTEVRDRGGTPGSTTSSWSTGRRIW